MATPKVDLLVDLMAETAADLMVVLTEMSWADCWDDQWSFGLDIHKAVSMVAGLALQRVAC